MASIYTTNFINYIQSLKDTPVWFIYMSQEVVRLKTVSKHLGHDYYLTRSPSQHEYFYIYVYKASDVKYIITESVNNKNPTHVLNFRRYDRGNEAVDFEHPYLANHGDHLTFGIQPDSNNKIEIDTHRTTYTYRTKNLVSTFTGKLGDRCHFKFQPNLNKKFQDFLRIKCISSSSSLSNNPKYRINYTPQNSYNSHDDLHLIHHLLNKMNGIDVPMRQNVKHKGNDKRNMNENIGGEGGAPRKNDHISYKNYDFMNDDFLAFIRTFLQELDHVPVFTCLYDANRSKNMVIFIDYDVNTRNILWIYMPKALKACFAFYNKSDATDKEKRQLKTFSESFNSRIAKINSLFE